MHKNYLVHVRTIHGRTPASGDWLIIISSFPKDDCKCVSDCTRIHLRGPKFQIIPGGTSSHSGVSREGSGWA